jgi:hypothetical protein
MQRLGERHRSPIVNRALRFLTIRLRSRPETQAFAEEAAQVRAQLCKKREAYIEALDERLALSAEIAYLDACLDKAVLVGLRRDLTVLTSDRPAIEKKLFAGVSPKSGMRPIGGEAQEHYVTGIIARLEADADFAPIASHAAKLRKRLHDLNDALAKRRELRIKERLALGDLEEETEHASLYYNRMHPQLKLLFPNDLPLVESFFFDLRAPSAAASPPAIEPEANEEDDSRSLEETVTEWSAPDE